MNGAANKFGGGRLPTGTPSLAWSSVVVVVSLLAGASIVHNIYKPDITIPRVEAADGRRALFDAGIGLEFILDNRDAGKQAAEMSESRSESDPGET